MPNMTGARFLAETLQAYGVSHYFFMPVSIVHAMPHLEELGIARIMAHSEIAAVYMADGYARVSRSAGVCGAQSVGAANLAAGLQDAYLGCSPVIALAGRLPQKQKHRNAYQEIDHRPSFQAVTKFSTEVTSIEEFPLFLRQAFREATSGTPGPAHLDLVGIDGNEIMLGEADLDVVVEEPFTQVPAFRPVADESSIKQALGMLAKAAKPIIVAGGGVTASDASQELIAFAQKLDIPVATALNAKAMFPAEHPLAVGVPGAYSRDCASRSVAGADIVFFIGSHTGGQVTHDWRVPKPGTKVIQLDINPAEIGRSYPVSAGLHGDVRATLQVMTSMADSGSHPDWVSTVQGYVAEWKANAAGHYNSEALPMRPERLCRELTDNLPSDSILVSDTGHAGIWTGTMIDLKHPEQSYIRCAGSLGWGIPAAIGAQCAAPDRPVVCFTGDGGAWYHLNEIETAVRCNVPAVFIINNNASLNQEKEINEWVFGEANAASDSMWKMSDVDFAKMAESMGAMGIQVTKPGDIGSALDRAVSARRPVVIEVRTDINGIAPPAWLPD